VHTYKSQEKDDILTAIFVLAVQLHNFLGTLIRISLHMTELSATYLIVVGTMQVLLSRD